MYFSSIGAYAGFFFYLCLSRLEMGGHSASQLGTVLRAQFDGILNYIFKAFYSHFHV